MKRYTICEAPVCVGSPTAGTEKAYQDLRADLGALFGRSADFCDFQGAREKPEILFDWRLHGLETVMLVARQLKENQSQAFAKGRMPITVGGDHSIAMASIAAVAEQYGPERTAVIYIDGHADINTECSTETGFIHGMPLAAAMGLCCDALTVGKHKINLYGENTYILGARSVDAAEWDILKSQGVTLYGPQQMEEQGEQILDEILKKTQGMAVHLSFDVDAIDGEEFRSTGYRMPNGMRFATVHALIKQLLDSGCVCSFDCVEYNPTLDDGKDKEKLLEIFRLFSV